MFRLFVFFCIGSIAHDVALTPEYECVEHSFYKYFPIFTILGLCLSINFLFMLLSIYFVYWIAWHRMALHGSRTTATRFGVCPDASFISSHNTDIGRRCARWTNEKRRPKQKLMLSKTKYYRQILNCFTYCYRLLCIPWCVQDTGEMFDEIHPCLHVSGFVWLIFMCGSDIWSAWALSLFFFWRK